MKELYEKNKSKIVLGIIIIMCLFFIWLLLIRPLIKFKDNEKVLLEAGKRYYEVDSTKLPSGSRIDEVTLQKLYDKDFISTDLRTSYRSELCDTKKSWVKVRKENGIYKYYVYLKCGIFESKGIDSEGPKITLNGSQEITVERGKKYNELGVSSVIDNKDGKIDTKKVTIDSSKVDTSKNGTYEVTYKVVDSFRNETIVTRKVIVNQNLTNKVKNSKNSLYVKLDGIIFRTIDVNDDGKVKLVTKNPMAYVNYDDVDEWLNEYFYSKFSDTAKDKIVENSKWCVDEISDPSNMTTCNKYGDKKAVGLLSPYEINKFKDKELLDAGIVWTNNTISGKATSYDVNNNKYINKSKNELYQVYPTVYLKKDLIILSGEGTYSSPFTFDRPKKAGTKVNLLNVGDYINYSGYLWRVIGKNESGSTKIIMNDVLVNENDEDISDTIESIEYNPDDKKSLANKILNEYSNYVNTKKLVKEKLEVRKATNKLKYKEKIGKTYKVKLAENSVFDLFSITEYAGYYYWYRDYTSNSTFYKGNGSILEKSNKGEYHVLGLRFIGNINETSSVVSGSGTVDQPYKIS